MHVLTHNWSIAKSLFNQDLVMNLIELGDGLGFKCSSLLEGKEEEERSYLGFGQGWVLEGGQSDPLLEIRDFMNRLKRVMVCNNPVQSDSPSFRLESGLIGYLDYEWGLRWQKPQAAKYRPGYFFRLCPVNLVILPASGKLVLEIFAETAEQAAHLFHLWTRELTSKLQALDRESANDRQADRSNPLSDPSRADTSRTEGLVSDSSVSPEDGIPVNWQANMTKMEFVDRVNRIKEYICAGDIFQAVFSQRFSCQIQRCPWQIYRHLRQVNPSPYLFYVEGSRETLVGSSPELLISSKGRKVATCPIAGTRPRGRTEKQDRELERELRADGKENAEHAMLVDLGRNDLGRVSRYGTVNVAYYADIVRYSHVMHLVSRVEGELAPGFDSLDALKAAFPAGTLSGAPKVKAMEILQELEAEPRGYYGGSLGVIRWNGDIDFCITIRTIALNKEGVSVQAGAGIVYDSLPELEYEETIHKAMALMKVVNDCAYCD